MSKNWTFTTYEDGKPVATERNLDDRQAIAAIRAAMAGEAVVARRGAEARDERFSPAELGAAAAFVRAA